MNIILLAVAHDHNLDGKLLAVIGVPDTADDQAITRAMRRLGYNEVIRIHNLKPSADVLMLIDVYEWLNPFRRIARPTDPRFYFRG